MVWEEFRGVLCIVVEIGCNGVDTVITGKGVKIGNFRSPTREKDVGNFNLRLKRRRNRTIGRVLAGFRN